MAKVSVIGAGSWGTALALLLYKNGHDVTVWSYQEEEVRMLSEKREHVSKLPGVKIPEGIFFTADIKEAVEEKDVVVLAVPSIHVRNTAKKINPYVKDGQILVDVAKGIEEDTLMTLSQQIRRDTAGRCGGPFRTKSCRGSRKRPSHDGLHWSTYRGDCKVFTAALYE